MRFMTWCVGMLVLFDWYAFARCSGESVGGLFFVALMFWFLVGLGALTVSVVRLVTSKMGAGLPGGRGARPGQAPTEKREG